MSLRGMRGRSALVTGACGEIGRALVARLCEEGARVVAADVDTQGLAMLGRETDLACAVQLDVTDAASTAQCLSDAVDVVGGVDMFVANAGVESQVLRVADFDVDDYRRVFEVNVLGAFLGSREVSRHMLERGSGSILFMASVGALKGVAGMSVYNASKHALLGLARSLAVETVGTGVRVNTLCPGAVDTRMMSAINAGQAEALGLDSADVEAAARRKHATGRLASTTEVAAAAAWILSEECAFMHNEVVTMTGGAPL